MITDCITFASYTLGVFVAGIGVGKLAEKIERLDRRTEDKERKDKKNDRR